MPFSITVQRAFGMSNVCCDCVALWLAVGRPEQINKLEANSISVHLVLCSVGVSFDLSKSKRWYREISAILERA